ncbi:MAG: copper resistance protein NlpE [Cardiobacteriaceae bacterium]|nr:copper resistance protein NlpE [Cardiobacteriaceae bacterium]
MGRGVEENPRSDNKPDRALPNPAATATIAPIHSHRKTDMQANKLILCTFISLTLITGCSSSDNKDNRSADPAANTQPLANARQSQNWLGTYQGILPCANCEGIATMVVLENNGKYTLRTRQLGLEDKDRKYQGTYSWKNDSTLVLSGDAQEKVFTVYDGYLQAMMPDGSPIPAHPGANYRLEKSF